MAEYIGLELCDPTTFEVSRLMVTGQAAAQTANTSMCGKTSPSVRQGPCWGQYEDWRDCTLWPQVPGSQNLPTKLAVKQGDPEAKNGVVGAFCRTYDIYRAMG